MGPCPNCGSWDQVPALSTSHCRFLSLEIAALAGWARKETKVLERPIWWGEGTEKLCKGSWLFRERPQALVGSVPWAHTVGAVACVAKSGDF